MRDRIEREGQRGRERERIWVVECEMFCLNKYISSKQYPQEIWHKRFLRIKNCIYENSFRWDRGCMYNFFHSVLIPPLDKWL